MAFMGDGASALLVGLLGTGSAVSSCAFDSTLTPLALPLALLRSPCRFSSNRALIGHERGVRLAGTASAGVEGGFGTAGWPLCCGVIPGEAPIGKLRWPRCVGATAA